MATGPDPQSVPTGPRRLLRCVPCGHTTPCSPTDLLRYTQRGWPRCCGEVMTFFVEADPPAAHDTEGDRPPPPG